MRGISLVHYFPDTLYISRQSRYRLAAMDAADVESDSSSGFFLDNYEVNEEDELLFEVRIVYSNPHLRTLFFCFCFVFLF